MVVNRLKMCRKKLKIPSLPTIKTQNTGNLWNFNISNILKIDNIEGTIPQSPLMVCKPHNIHTISLEFCQITKPGQYVKGRVRQLMKIIEHPTTLFLFGNIQLNRRVPLSPLRWNQTFPLTQYAIKDPKCKTIPTLSAFSLQHTFKI